jgi:hypothetical protein
MGGRYLPPALAVLPHLVMPAHHDVRASDVMTRRLHGTLAAAAEQGPKDFAELLLVPGVGARTVESLAMVAEVIYGTPARFADPARFSLAHGGSMSLSLEGLICKLRKKLANASGGKDYIETIWGRGYVLRELIEAEVQISA